MEFKVGDKVKFIGVGCSPNGPSEKANGDNLTVGAIYTIKNIGLIRSRSCMRSSCRLPPSINIGTVYQNIRLEETIGDYCNAIFVPTSRRVRRTQAKKGRDGCRLPDTHEWLKVIGK